MDLALWATAPRSRSLGSESESEEVASGGLRLPNMAVQRPEIENDDSLKRKQSEVTDLFLKMIHNVILRNEHSFLLGFLKPYLISQFNFYEEA